LSGEAGRSAEVFELELVVDGPPAPLPGAKSVASQQPARGGVFPQSRSGEEPQAVGERAVVREAGESGADAHPLERIGDLCAICIAHVSGDAHDRVVALIHCGDGLVVRVINVGDEGELARCQLALGRKKALVARFRGEAGKQGGQCGMVVSSNLPERDPRSIGDHQALGSRC
jgi:hypothetical protein